MYLELRCLLLQVPDISALIEHLIMLAATLMSACTQNEAALPTLAGARYQCLD